MEYCIAVSQHGKADALFRGMVLKQEDGPVI